MSRTRRRTWLGRVALALASAFLTVVVLELVASLVLHLRRSTPELPAALALEVRTDDYHVPTRRDPFLAFRIRPDVDTGEVRTNAHGLRNGPVALEPEPGTFRLLLLGGSTAWSYTSRSNEETLAARLERWFEEHGDAYAFLAGRRVEVLNAAVPGYVSWQCALAYARDRHRFRPDAVVSLDGVNDVYTTLKTGRVGAPLPDGAVRADGPGAALGVWVSRRLVGLKTRELWAQLYPTGRLEQRGVPRPAAIARSYAEAIDSLAAAALGAGTDVFAVLQPLLLLPSTKPLDAFERAWVDDHARARPGEREYYARSFRRLRRSLADAAAARPNLHALDATRVFADLSEQAYVDHCHLTPAGRERLAAWLGKRVAAELDRR